MSGIYLEGTNQRAILLMHAYTGTSADVRMLGSALNQIGYTVYMPELSGHGTDDIRNILKFGIDIWKNEAILFVEELVSKGYKEVAMFGLSMGGLLTMHVICEKHPNIIGGGTFNAPVPIGNVDKVHHQFLHYAKKLYRQEMGDESYYLESISNDLTIQLNKIQQFSEYVSDKLTSIEIPIYIAQSGKDELIDISIGQTMANRMLFTTVDFHYFDQATHVITVGAYRKAFNETVVSFVENLGWSI